MCLCSGDSVGAAGWRCLSHLGVDMQKYSSGGSVTTTTSEDLPSQRRIQRLRLTLHSGEPSSGQDETKNTTGKQMQEEKTANGMKRRRNGYVEPPEQHPPGVTNGVRENSPLRLPKVYGAVHRKGTDGQQEVMARESSVNHLRDQMNYIREVRDSLEKVRERMYGQFGGMQQSMQKLSQDIRTANAQKQSLEMEVKTRTAAMDSFEQMNSSLISANIDLQKSLLEKCVDRADARDKIQSLCSSCQQAEETLRERDKELAAALAANRSLRLQVEVSKEANSQALQETIRKLQNQYEERLQNEQRKHREEVEALRAQLDDYVKRLEEAEKNLRIAEAKIAERDQRIIEVERLLDCMGKEKSQLQQKLQECETRLHRLGNTDQVDANTAKRAQKLEGEASGLKERIKHLNDMVFCQQRKVKGMIEEVETLRNKMVQKDMFITDLLNKIALAECEKLSAAPVHTREIGVGCDLPLRTETQAGDEAQSRPVRQSPLPRSRVESSLLNYSPVQYSRWLQSNSAPLSKSTTSSTQSPPSSVNPVQSSSAQNGTEASASPQTSSAPSSPERSTPAVSSMQARSIQSRINTPYMKLLEMTPRMNTLSVSVILVTGLATLLEFIRFRFRKDEVMSSSLTERQGYTGDLLSRSKDELCEILLRQEKLLSNKRFIQSLPDKGRKISDFVQRVRLALAHHEEEEKRLNMLSSVRTEFQSKYQQALSQRQPGNHIDTPSVALSETSQKAQQGTVSTPEWVDQRGSLLKAPPAVQTVSVDDLSETAVSMETVSDGVAGLSVATDRTEEKDLAEALEKVTLTEGAVSPTGLSAAEHRDRAGDGPSHSERPQKKPHYIEVLEKSETNPTTRRPKFKPNQMLQRTDGSSAGSSPSRSPGGVAHLSADARRERDRKHLDDITAARLPPLHYSPAQLLSLEESVSLQQEHNRKCEELQAKMATQKLSERLGVGMTSYSPDVDQAGYRETHADGAQPSSDED
ncbi:protein GRINL1A [Anguilla rostrata]|uniref:protein GRINL1A n=1 Tax=Anguilla rostrata TaxID=7938 RepID=UPI0030CDB6A1